MWINLNHFFVATGLALRTVCLAFAFTRLIYFFECVNREAVPELRHGRHEQSAIYSAVVGKNSTFMNNKIKQIEKYVSKQKPQFILYSIDLLSNL